MQFLAVFGDGGGLFFMSFYKLLRFEKLFRKVPFSRRITVGGLLWTASLTAEIKLWFQITPGVVWKGPEPFQTVTNIYKSAKKFTYQAYVDHGTLQKA